MGATKIEWADRVWNPVSGCSPISEGCANCYARRFAHRLRGRCGYPEDELFRVTLHPERLGEPLRWRKPRRVFVVSMGDLFHEDVPESFIASVFAVFGAAHQHTYLVLTKRPDRMRDFMDRWLHCDMAYPSYLPPGISPGLPYGYGHYRPEGRTRPPLPNVWLGVTAENQARADERISILLQIPAAVRFVSVEPMLDAVDLRSWLFNLRIPCSCGYVFDTASASVCEHGCTMRCPSCGTCKCDHEEKWRREGKLLPGEPGWVWVHPAVVRKPLLDWVIAGGETGPGARPFHPDWIRRIRDDCVAARVPFFLKHLGEYITAYDAGFRIDEKDRWGRELGAAWAKSKPEWRCGTQMVHVGRRAAGRLLDGREWNEVPGGVSDSHA